MVLMIFIKCCFNESNIIDCTLHSQSALIPYFSFENVFNLRFFQCFSLAQLRMSIYMNPLTKTVANEHNETELFVVCSAETLKKYSVIHINWIVLIMTYLLYTPTESIYLKTNFCVFSCFLFHKYKLNIFLSFN
jgi:hypothetical protein